MKTKQHFNPVNNVFFLKKKRMIVLNAINISEHRRKKRISSFLAKGKYRKTRRKNLFKYIGNVVNKCIYASKV